MLKCERANLQVTCGKCGILDPSAWEGIPVEVRDKLAERKSIRRIAKGGHLFHQGGRCDALYRLVSGVILLRKTDQDGNSLVVRMANASSTLGYRAFIREEPHAVSAYCATDVVVCHIPAHTARWAFEQSRPLQMQFAANMANDLDQTENHVLNILALTVRDRVLALIDEMARDFGRPEGNGLRIAMPILRSDMAAMLGIARESMSRCIRALEEDGLVLFERNSVFAPSLARFNAVLAEIQGGPPCPSQGGASCGGDYAEPARLTA